MPGRLSWRSYFFNVFILLVFVLVIVGISEYISEFLRYSSYIVLGFFLVVYEAVNTSVKSVAASVGGGGVLAALVFAFIALAVAEYVHDKLKELTKKVEELEEKLEAAGEEEDS